MADSKALSLLKSTKSVKERANNYFYRITKSIDYEVLEPLRKKMDKIDDQIFNLEDFSLATDKNAGQTALTSEQIQEKFTRIIDLKYERALIEAELKCKEETYNLYFK